MKARELSGVPDLLFLRNSVTGALEARPRSGAGITLNAGAARQQLTQPATHPPRPRAARRHGMTSMTTSARSRVVTISSALR